MTLGEQGKTAYFSRFALKYLSAFRPHFKKGETLGKGGDLAKCLGALSCCWSVWRYFGRNGRPVTP